MGTLALVRSLAIASLLLLLVAIPLEGLKNHQTHHHHLRHDDGIDGNVLPHKGKFVFFLSPRSMSFTALIKPDLATISAAFVYFIFCANIETLIKTGSTSPAM